MPFPLFFCYIYATTDDGICQVEFENFFIFLENCPDFFQKNERFGHILTFLRFRVKVY